MQNLNTFNMTHNLNGLFQSHFMPLVSFYTPWKHQKASVFWCFQGVYKDNNGMEWVNPGSHLTVFEQTELFESPLNMQSAIKRLFRFMTYELHGSCFPKNFANFTQHLWETVSAIKPNLVISFQKVPYVWESTEFQRRCQPHLSNLFRQGPLCPVQLVAPGMQLHFQGLWKKIVNFPEKCILYHKINL